jgi:hypothetical protein
VRYVLRRTPGGRRTRKGDPPTGCCARRRIMTGDMLGLRPGFADHRSSVYYVTSSEAPGWHLIHVVDGCCCCCCHPELIHLSSRPWLQVKKPAVTGKTPDVVVNSPVLLEFRAPSKQIRLPSFIYTCFCWVPVPLL